MKPLARTLAAFLIPLLMPVGLALAQGAAPEAAKDRACRESRENCVAAEKNRMRDSFRQACERDPAACAERRAHTRKATAEQRAEHQAQGRAQQRAEARRGAGAARVGN